MHSSLISFKALLVLAACWFFSLAVNAEARSPSVQQQDLSESERWVIQQIREGKAADLDTYAPDEQAHALRADFIARLLTGTIPNLDVQPQGVHIEHAVIRGPLNLRNAEIPYETRFISCQFEDALTLSRSLFQKQLSFDGSRFAAKVSFNNIQAEQGLSFRGASFEGPADFTSAAIAADLEADAAKFTAGVSFNSITVGHAAFFPSTAFSGPVDFTGAAIAVNIESQGTLFASTARFNGMHVGHAALFEGAVFSGAVDFTSADIAINFEANDTQFTAPDQFANFNSLKVGNAAFFRRASFAGPVSFTGAHIATNFEASEARFANPGPEQGASFNSLTVAHTAFFTNTVFAGPVDFTLADIGTNLEAQGAKFTNPDQPASFNGIHVGQSAFFTKAVFSGPVDFYGMQAGNTVSFYKARFAKTADFTSANIAADFRADQAQFLDSGLASNFNRMNVRQSVLFDDTVFQGRVSMTDGEFLNLTIRSHRDTPLVYPTLELSRTVIHGEFKIENLSLQDFIAPSLHVEGPTAFEQITIKQRLSLENGSFTDFYLHDVAWPDNPQPASAGVARDGGTWGCIASIFNRGTTNHTRAVHIDGMRYQNIGMVVNQKEARGRLIQLADDAAYNAQVYTQLEAFFKGQGYRELANKTFIRMKQRECAEAEGLFSKLWNTFLDLFVGYGRAPGRAILASALVVAVGWIVFWNENGMELKEDQRNEEPARRRRYNGFWYSLGLFLPGVDLHVTDVWRPRPDRPRAWFYLRLHIIAGWILIPIGLLAVTGLFQ